MVSKSGGKAGMTGFAPFCFSEKNEILIKIVLKDGLLVLKKHFLEMAKPRTIYCSNCRVF